MKIKYYRMSCIVSENGEQIKLNEKNFGIHILKT